MPSQLLRPVVAMTNSFTQHTLFLPLPSTSITHIRVTHSRTLSSPRQCAHSSNAGLWAELLKWQPVCISALQTSDWRNYVTFYFTLGCFCQSAAAACINYIDSSLKTFAAFEPKAVCHHHRHCVKERGQRLKTVLCSLWEADENQIAK